MNILFLTQILPYPPDSGPRVKTWHVLKYLARRGHKITLISFIRPEEEPFLPAVRTICHEVLTVPMRRSRMKDAGYLIRSLITRRPFLIERDESEAIRSRVQKVVASGSIDVIHADQLTMAQFALPYRNSHGKPALIFDAHNAVWTIVERLNSTLPFYYRLPLLFEADRVKAYEGRIVHEFDHTLSVTVPDEQALREAVGEQNPAVHATEVSITVIPIAVDTQVVQRDPDRIQSHKILTLGTLYYPPNADGIRWFLNDVFPLVQQALPEATLTIVGKNPPADFLRLARESRGRVVVTGYIPNLDPYYADASVMVIPVRAGGGMRVRILEAFARAMPVITTTVGLEGIQATNGRDVLVADEPDDFARSTIHLLSDVSLQNQLSANGRRLAVEKYDWQVVLGQLDGVYESLA